MKTTLKLLVLAGLSSGLLGAGSCFNGKKMHEITEADLIECINTINAKKTKHKMLPLNSHITSCGQKLIIELEGFVSEAVTTKPCDENCDAPEKTNDDAQTLPSVNNPLVPAEQLETSTKDASAEAPVNPYDDRRD